MLLALPLNLAIGLDCQMALLDGGVLSTATVGVSLLDVTRFVPTVLITTPTDVLRLAQAAAGERVDLAEAPLRLVLLTGEPGASIGVTRRIIEERCGAQCMDVYGLTELGVVGWTCPSRPDGIHLVNSTLELEACEPESDRRVGDREVGELVVTVASEWSNTSERLRTGDLVRLTHECCGCTPPSTWAEGGVLGRVDERMTIRGADLLPVSIEEVVRRHPAVIDFRVRVYARRSGTELEVQLEPDVAISSEGDRARVAAEVSEDLKRSLGVRLACDVVAPCAFADDQDAGRRARRFKRQ